MNESFEEKLLLSAREAAAALGVCEKTLWNYSRPRGDIPCLKLGARTLYTVDDLRAWISQQKMKTKEGRNVEHC